MALKALTKPVITGLLGICGFVTDDGMCRRVLGPKSYAALLSKLKFTSRQRIGPPIYATAYKVVYDPVEKGSILYLPRDTARILMDGGVIDSMELTIPQTPDIKFELDVDLMENQQLAADAIFAQRFTPERLADGFGTCLLDMAPGLGKTFTAAAVIGRLGKRALYVCVGRKLQMQAAKDLSTAFPGASVVSPEGSAECKAATGDIVVAVINSIIGLDETFYSGFGTVIIDEVHLYCAVGRRELFWKCQTRAVLGMSGTTDHNRFGFDHIYKKHLGEPIVAADIPGFEPPTKFSVRVKVIKYNGSAVDKYTDGHIDFGAMLAQFIVDPVRNKLIVDEIMLAVEGKRPCIVFSDRVEHLRELRKMLPGVSISMMTGTADDSELEAANTVDVILTTYGYSGTGLSIPRLVHEILATPRRRGHEQIAKRIMRARSDPGIERIIVDIVDKNTKIAGQYYARSNVYRAQEFKLEKIKYN